MQTKFFEVQFSNYELYTMQGNLYIFETPQNKIKL
jgi:hypothetical protein